MPDLPPGLDPAMLAEEQGPPPRPPLRLTGAWLDAADAERRSRDRAITKQHRAQTQWRSDWSPANATAKRYHGQRRLRV